MFVITAFAQKEKNTGDPAFGVTGGVKRHADFKSKFVDMRNVDVWLPPSYGKDKKKKYPVLYMHDGQNLFDPKISFGGVDWAVDETMTRLIEEKKIREAIVVGIWNTPKRVLEYMPQKAVAQTETVQFFDIKIPSKDFISDNYLKFIVIELKPFIDSNYRTLTKREDTFIMGSSMGGLISLYAISEYPNVFGGAGCVSTHFPAGNGIVIDYMKTNLPNPKIHKIYFDYGTATLDAQYEPYQLKADEVMKAKGYVRDKNWITKKFEGAEHSEKAWRKRVDIPLIFFLGVR
jgi:predicted alpha/beta superfamily hydrolase